MIDALISWSLRNRAAVLVMAALLVEKTHAQLYQKLLDNLGKSQENYPYYVCPVCGFTAEKTAPGICPVCGTKGEMFKKIE